MQSKPNHQLTSMITWSIVRHQKPTFNREIPQTALSTSSWHERCKKTQTHASQYFTLLCLSMPKYGSYEGFLCCSAILSVSTCKLKYGVMLYFILPSPFRSPRTHYVVDFIPLAQDTPSTQTYPDREEFLFVLRKLSRFFVEQRKKSEKDCRREGDENLYAYTKITRESRSKQIKSHSKLNSACCTALERWITLITANIYPFASQATIAIFGWKETYSHIAWCIIHLFIHSPRSLCVALINSKTPYRLRALFSLPKINSAGFSTFTRAVASERAKSAKLNLKLKRKYLDARSEASQASVRNFRDSLAVNIVLYSDFQLTLYRQSVGARFAVRGL